MLKKYPALDLNKIKTYSIKKRKSKVKLADEAIVHQPGNSFQQFLNHLPPILAANDLNEIISTIAKAHRKRKIIMVG
ncbi:MAG: hypothetical protein ACHQYP_03345, partial [Nitrospiria bacterium]